ncbi:tumor necrosis factor receptor superfamily member 5 isoform X2 [Dendrobates tinctorius]|uniref:tumor necrosis factor receptor superfamily member 5 isoform X2 n=1 Tax=Dendrobates tinctorius TaxID=92724 RepID=UPI003CCA55E1
MSPWIILLVLCVCYCQSSELQCDNKEYERNNRCCSLCDPGERLLEDCTELNKTLCIPCSVGEYQEKYNRETSCLLHKECNEQLGFQIISKGTSTKNVDCRCQSGKHCSSEACETCVQNTVCGPGEGVIQRAARSSDTQCSLCKEGTYSSKESDVEPCKNWSKCGDADMILQKGTPTTDVVCEPRSNTWVYVVVIIVVLVALFVPATVFIRKSYCKDKNKKRQTPPKENNEQQPIKPVEFNFNLPEEDQDDQDITMQGLPVAQEQGKDYQMSQEEV